MQKDFICLFVQYKAHNPFILTLKVLSYIFLYKV